MKNENATTITLTIAGADIRFTPTEEVRERNGDG